MKCYCTNQNVQECFNFNGIISLKDYDLKWCKILQVVHEKWCFGSVYGSEKVFNRLRNIIVTCCP